MEKIGRRRLLQRTGIGAVATHLGMNLSHGLIPAGNPDSISLKPSFEWIRSTRLPIAEGYCPPFYTSLDYDPEKALAVARRLNCDSFRYPTYSYVAFYPTKANFPHHSELGAQDPFEHTGSACKERLVQEEFLPLPNVQVRLRVPEGRTPRSVALMWSRVTPSWKVRDGWVELTIPEVHPYEAVYVDVSA